MQRTQPRQKNRRRPAWPLVATAALLLSPSLAAAQAGNTATGVDEPEKPRYRVEIILFAYSNEVASGGEVFPPDEPPAADGAFPDTDDATNGSVAEESVPEYGDRIVPADEPADDEFDEKTLTGNIELQVLEREQLELEAEYQRLEQLDAYRPVLWTGWTQAAFEQDVTPEIRLRRLAQAPLTYDGTLKLYLSRFLHLVVDLAMDGPAAASTEPYYGDSRGDSDFANEFVPGRVRYRIHEDRIFRNGELRYFDHPKFGLLARVNRVETSSSDADDGEPAQAVPPQ